MPTSYTTRTIPTTSYNLTRLGGAYLLDWSGDYILDSDGERIITIVTGGTLPFTNYTERTQIGTNYFLKIDDTNFLKIDDTNKLIIEFVPGTPYSVRTPI